MWNSQTLPDYDNSTPCTGMRPASGASVIEYRQGI